MKGTKHGQAFGAGGRPGKDADMERHHRNESVQSGKVAPFDTQVDIRFYHYRFKLADPDGVSGKAAIDGLVHCGLLRDDSAKEVREVRHFQIKVASEAEEKTVIEIEEV